MICSPREMSKCRSLSLMSARYYRLFKLVWSRTLAGCNNVPGEVTSHSWPVNPTGQMHRYPLTWSTHSPPFLQGLEAQSSMSVRQSRPEKKKQMVHQFKDGTLDDTSVSSIIDTIYSSGRLAWNRIRCDELEESAEFKYCRAPSGKILN